jgi:hypothetical protein
MGHTISAQLVWLTRVFTSKHSKNTISVRLSNVKVSLHLMINTRLTCIHTNYR